MKISQQGVEFIKDMEGLRLDAYKPTPQDRWTIGYGSTHGVHQGMMITPEIADMMLQDDLWPVEECINRTVTIRLTQNEFDALCSLVYNVGTAAWGKSKALSYLNGRNLAAFADQAFGDDGWIHQAGKVLPGLVNRRRKEQELFFGADTA